MRWLGQQAESLGMGTRVVFFVSPPHFFFHPERAVPLLTTGAERRRLVRSVGVDRAESLRFGPRWAEMPHTRFFEEYIVGRWNAGGLFVGKDFAFGKGRKGDLEFMRSACEERGMRFGVLPLVRVGGRKISSSRIRKLLLGGDVQRAALMLGRPHAVAGKVVRGRGLGRRIGIPTANIRVPEEVLSPAGVYQVKVFGAGFGGRADMSPRPIYLPAGSMTQVAEGADGVCNVGYRPTVEGRRKVKRVTEVHIPACSKDLYGKTLRIEFIRRLRPERKFKSLDALKKQILRDIKSLNS